MNIRVTFNSLHCYVPTDDFLEGSSDEVWLKVIGQNTRADGSGEISLINEYNLLDFSKDMGKLFNTLVCDVDVTRFDLIRFHFRDVDTTSDDDTIGAFTVSGKSGRPIWAPERSTEYRGTDPSGEVFFMTGREGKYLAVFTADVS